jgi:formylglycine-generating enzyme required for sulfatase activity
LLVPGGTFYRSYDGVDNTDMSHPATVADFYLDKYEITVGRFRAFVNAGMGTQANPPAAGAGAHPLIPGSGWDSTWNTNLPANTPSLTASLTATTTRCGSFGSPPTWTDTAGSNESNPISCIDWYAAFAFCAWDGGRLPTEAEWNYAASGGSEQRYYPWSSPPASTTIDASYAVYCDDADFIAGSCVVQNVGSKSPKGDGKWGQADLGGNVLEWTLDYFFGYQVPCDNCADLNNVIILGNSRRRVIRGGSCTEVASALQSATRNDVFLGVPTTTDSGVRCVRPSF